MADERNLEIVIRAKDEFSTVMEKASRSAEESASSIKDSLGGVSLAGGVEGIHEYATGLERVLGLESERVRMLEDRSRAEQELIRLAESSPYKNPEPGEVDSEISNTYSDYQKRLAMLQSYNAQVLSEMINAGQTQADVEAAYAGLSIEYAKKTRDFKIQYASESFGAMSNFMENLYVATGSKNRAIFEVMKATAIAQTVIDTYRAAQSAYAAMAGIPVVGPALGVAAAAAAIAAGLARVEQIRSTELGGGASISSSGTANPAYDGGSTEAYPVETTLSEESQASQSVTINVYNPLSEQNWSDIVENDIIPALNDAADRNISVKINVSE
ncbi:MAG: hypothetical protein ACE5EB_08290 [Thermodesulfobacteriota bacterium]